MAANVLNSGRAIEVSGYVVRAFVRLRELMIASSEVATKLGELERKVAGHDEAIRSLVTTIKRLMESPPVAPRKRIGFRVEEGRPSYGKLQRRRAKFGR